ncbi:MAG: hypothetical protein RLZZ04_3052 [Cyanobacteriota bacterium]
MTLFIHVQKKINNYNCIDRHAVTAYSYNMGRKEKLLTKAEQNPKGLSFSDFETLLSLCGWTFKRQKGSHRLWYSPQGYRLSIQPKGGKAKDYQVAQF